MIQFNISNHPTLVGITRKAELKGMEVSIDNKTVTLSLFITHFLNGIAAPEMNKFITSVANNNHTFSHPTIEDEQIGEFDYWLLLMEAGTPLKTMLEGGIANIDAMGVINRKCSYLS